MEVPEYNLEEWNSLLTLGQSVVDQQEVDKGSPLVVALAGGLAILAFQLLLPLLASFLGSGSSYPPWKGFQ